MRLYVLVLAVAAAVSYGLFAAGTHPARASAPPAVRGVSGSVDTHELVISASRLYGLGRCPEATADQAGEEKGQEQAEVQGEEPERLWSGAALSRVLLSYRPGVR